MLPEKHNFYSLIRSKNKFYRVAQKAQILLVKRCLKVETYPNLAENGRSISCSDRVRLSTCFFGRVRSEHILLDSSTVEYICFSRVRSKHTDFWSNMRWAHRPAMHAPHYVLFSRLWLLTWPNCTLRIRRRRKILPPSQTMTSTRSNRTFPLSGVKLIS